MKRKVTFKNAEGLIKISTIEAKDMNSIDNLAQHMLSYSDAVSYVIHSNEEE